MKLTDQIKDRWTGKLLCGGLSLEVVLERHKKWVYDEEGGERAVLTRADLTGAVLTHADLTSADLTGAVLTHAVLTHADLTDADLTDAVLTRADLTRADLTHADLTGAVLTHADLTDADLTDAVLTHADLTDADLTDADLTRADLTRADLTDAVLTRADLTDAVLTDAVLTHADLRSFKHDLWGILLKNQAEVPALLQALRGGKIDGSVYSGECACLMGTIANIRKCDVYSLQDVNSSAAAERWFMQISKGKTPANNGPAKLTEEWILEFMALTGQKEAA